MAAELGPSFKGGYVGPEQFGALMSTNRPWIAMMRSSANHWVVVDGMEGGNVMIRDPWSGGSTYGMSPSSFQKFWTGNAVFSP